MPIVRPAKTDDIESFMELARLSGPGFTSLPEDRERLEATIASSMASFADPAPDLSRSHYLLMLEDDEGAVAGCAGVKPQTGANKPFFNFKILKVSQVSNSAGRRFDMDILMLVNEYASCTEVGTLFVHPRARGGGVGSLLAKARYLLMAAAPERFAPTIIAELRGVVDRTGHSPFWEHLGKKFFNMSFPEADHLNAITDNQFILDLMPKYPIYLELLHDDAQAVVGQVHETGRGAYAMLMDEGFRYDRVVDIFDGGPLVCAPRSDIRTIRESRTATVRANGAADGADALICNDVIQDFAVTRAPLHCDGDTIAAPANLLARLGLNPGDTARIWTYP